MKSTGIHFPLLSIATFLFIISCGQGPQKQDSHSEEAIPHQQHEHSAHEEHNHSVADSHEGHNHSVADSHEGHNHSDGVVEFSTEAAHRAGIESTIVEPSAFQASIHCSGSIIPSTKGETYIIAPNSGVISWAGGKPSIGKKISENELIATISSESISQSKIAYENAEKDYLRAKSLLNDHIISDKEYNAIEANYLNALNDWKGLEILSPISAKISEIYVEQGSFVNVGEPIANLLSLEGSIGLKVYLPEKYLSQTDKISGANFKLSYMDEVRSLSEFGGKLISVGSKLEDGYIPMVFELRNEISALSYSFAEVWLLTKDSREVISLPESALIEEQGEYFVYVKIEEEDYLKQSVSIGLRNGKEVEIISGLNGGEKVVVKGAYQLKLASASVIPGHSHNH